MGDNLVPHGLSMDWKVFCSISIPPRSSPVTIVTPQVHGCGNSRKAWNFRSRRLRIDVWLCQKEGTMATSPKRNALDIFAIYAGGFRSHTQARSRIYGRLKCHHRLTWCDTGRQSPISAEPQIGTPILSKLIWTVLCTRWGLCVLTATLRCRKN
jgi:hypothetical protein